MRMSSPLIGYRHAFYFIFFFCLKLPRGLFYISANSKGSDENALMRRLAWAFADRQYDEYPFFRVLAHISNQLKQKKHTWEQDDP